jgi:hypothetical protein
VASTGKRAYPRSTPKPTLDDLCAAVARLEYMLDWADPDILDDLHARVCAGKRPDRDAMAALIGEHLERKLRRRKR